MFKFSSAGGNKSSRRVSTAHEALTAQGADILGLSRSSTASSSATFGVEPGSATLSPVEQTTSPISTPISPMNHGFQHLVTPHLPFDPDFTTIYSTLCDTLIDTYATLGDLVTGPEVCGVALGEVWGKVDKKLRAVFVQGVVGEFGEGSKVAEKQEVAGLGRLVLGGLM